MAFYLLPLPVYPTSVSQFSYDTEAGSNRISNHFQNVWTLSGPSPSHGSGRSWTVGQKKMLYVAHRVVACLAGTLCKIHIKK